MSFPILITIVILCSLVLFCFKTNPGAPLVVKNSPSNAEGVGLIPGEGAGIPYASKPKTQSVKEKQCCSKFNKDFKKRSTSRKIFKKNSSNCTNRNSKSSYGSWSSKTPVCKVPALSLDPSKTSLIGAVLFLQKNCRQPSVPARQDTQVLRYLNSVLSIYFMKEGLEEGKESEKGRVLP